MATSLPKALRILNIVAPPAEPPGPGLLDIPRELRDLIWAMVLHEPHLLDRKHAITCELGDRSADYLTPPAAMRCIPRPRPYPAPPSTPQAEENCLKLCVRRKSLALLRVSKQLHTEAINIWSKQGMQVYFMDSDVMLNTISQLPQAARQRIHRLTICDYLPYNSIRLHDGREGYFEYLSRLENLETIDISPSVVRGGPYWMIKLLQMQNLKKIVLSVPPKEMFDWARADSPAWRSGFSTFATVGFAIDVNEEVPCAHQPCTRGRPGTAASEPQRVSVEHWCSTCKQTLDETRQRAKELTDLAEPTWDMRQRKAPDLSTIFRRLRHEAPTHSKTYPIVGTRIIDGQTYQTTLWGLPEDSPKARQRREAEIRIASIPAPAPSPFVPDAEDDSDDPDQVKGFKRCKPALRRMPIRVEAGEPYTKALARKRTRVEVRRGEVTQINEAEARYNRNVNKEKRERVQRRYAVKAKGAVRGQRERETDVERKAARKRVTQT